MTPVHYSLRLSDTQRATLEALQVADRPLTAYEVLEVLRADRPSAAPPTAYRALEKLISVGLAHRLESINAYVACCTRHEGEAAPVFAICDDCGGVNELVDTDALRTLAARAKADGFAPHRSIVELHGRCAVCRKGTA